LELPYFGSVSLFWVGVLGSVVVEIGACARAAANAEGDLPARYRKPVYLFVRGLLALSGGTLAVVFDSPTALAAFYLGASAPIVLDKLAQGALPTIPNRSGEKIE
jgi:hypothetical protein